MQSEPFRKKAMADVGRAVTDGSSRRLAGRAVTDGSGRRLAGRAVTDGSGRRLAARGSDRRHAGHA